MSIGTSFYATTVQLTEIHCGECGGTYAISERYRRQKYEEGKSWHCPYCEISWGYAEGENARLKRERDAAKQREQLANNRAEDYRRRRDEADRRRAAMKGQVTKIKNRVSKGVCPCCNRTFQDLQRHMSTQHPAWAPDVETA